MINSEHRIQVGEYGEFHVLNVYDEHRNLLASVEVHENPSTDQITIKVDCAEERVLVKVQK